jgi:hypothetical protein
MFCTACAAMNPVAASRCAICGVGLPPRDRPAPSATPLRRSPHHSRGPAVLSQSSVLSSQSSLSQSSRLRHGILRLLYLFPVLALLTTGAVAAERHRADQASLAGWYARAQTAAAAGDYQVAAAAYAAAAGFRDADARRADALTALTPYRDAYLDGIAALDAGHFDDAIAALLPVARDLPRYEDVTARLADARRRHADELRHQVETAEASRDWLGAERSLVTLVAADPGDPGAAPRLAALRRDHAPLVLAHDHGLYLVGPDGADEHLLTDAVPAIWPTWSPDRSHVAFISLDPNDTAGKNVALYVIAVDGTGLTRLSQGLSAHAPPLWSPDGAHIAYTSLVGYDHIRELGAISVRVVDVASHRETDLSGPSKPLSINPSWSPTGDRLAFVSKDQPRGEPVTQVAGDVYVATVATGATINLTGGRVRDAWSVAWSPVADRLLVYTLYGQSWYEPPQTGIRLLDAETGNDDGARIATEHVSAPVWSPDGSRFAFVDGERSVHVRSRDGADAAVDIASDLSGELSWSPDGGVLLAAATDPAEPSTLIPVAADLGTPHSLRFNFDYDTPFFGPPQWAPIHPALPAGPPSIAGTGLDPAGMGDSAVAAQAGEGQRTAGRTV